jgi:outer membrane cobalamin receptor
MATDAYRNQSVSLNLSHAFSDALSRIQPAG